MEEDIIATEHRVRAYCKGGSQMQGVLGGQMLLSVEFPREFPDGLRRPLSLSAYAGKPQHFCASLWKRAYPGFVIMHERPNKIDLALIRAADDFQARQRFDLNPRIEWIIEGPLKAVVVEINGLHLI